MGYPIMVLWIFLCVVDINLSSGTSIMATRIFMLFLAAMHYNENSSKRQVKTKNKTLVQTLATDAQ